MRWRRARLPTGPARVAALVALVAMAVAVLGGCSSSPRSPDAFCRQGPVLAKAKQAVDTASGGDLAQSKSRMAAYDQAIQKAVSVAPDELRDDIEPLGKMWAQIDQQVQRARSTDELSAATQSVLAERQATYQRSSDAVSNYTGRHCTLAGGTK